MIVCAILGTFEAILGHVGRILALSWEDLVASWVHFGVCKFKVEQTEYVVERCDEASTHDFPIKPIYF